MTGTIRLTFRYSGTDVRLAETERAEMIAPPGEPARLEEGQAGSWVEVLDADGQILHQRGVHNPFRLEVEAVDDAEAGTMRWHAVDRHDGEFEVLVPDLPAADTVKLYSNLRITSQEAAIELGRWPIRKAE